MDAAVLDRARQGDERAFAELTGAYRPELHLHCYRMLGSLTDADDLVQETLLAAWRALGGFAGRSTVRAWLYRIATNRCLNAIRDSRRRPPAEPAPPFEPPQPSRRSDVTWLQPYPDARLDAFAGTDPGPSEQYEVREAVELAFIEALQRLAPRQTAALVLVGVLGFPPAEVAGMLDTTPTAVKGLLQRARASLGPREVGEAPPPFSAAEQALARRFADAFSRDDPEGVVALLTDDAWLKMPPAPHEYAGVQAIRRFLEASAAGRAGRRLRLAPARANGQPAFVSWLDEPDGTPVGAAGIVVLTLRGDRISEIARFLDPRLPARFG